MSRFYIWNCKKWELNQEVSFFKTDYSAVKCNVNAVLVQNELVPRSGSFSSWVKMNQVMNSVFNSKKKRFKEKMAFPLTHQMEMTQQRDY